MIIEFIIDLLKFTSIFFYLYIHIYFSKQIEIIGTSDGDPLILRKQIHISQGIDSMPILIEHARGIFNEI